MDDDSIRDKRLQGRWDGLWASGAGADSAPGCVIWLAVAVVLAIATLLGYRRRRG